MISTNYDAGSTAGLLGGPCEAPIIDIVSTNARVEGGDLVVTVEVLDLLEDEVKCAGASLDPIRTRGETSMTVILQEPSVALPSYWGVDPRPRSDTTALMMVALLGKGAASGRAYILEDRTDPGSVGSTVMSPDGDAFSFSGNTLSWTLPIQGTGLLREYGPSAGGVVVPVRPMKETQAAPYDLEGIQLSLRAHGHTVIPSPGVVFAHDDARGLDLTLSTG